MRNSHFFFALEGEKPFRDSDKEKRIEIDKEISIKTLGFRLDFPQHETLCTRVDKKPNREYHERENLFIE